MELAVALYTFPANNGVKKATIVVLYRDSNFFFFFFFRRLVFAFYKGYTKLIHSPLHKQKTFLKRTFAFYVKKS